MKKLLIFVASFVILAVPRISQSCSCAEDPVDLMTSYNQASVVFFGRCVAGRILAKSAHEERGSGEVKNFTFRVEQSFKGPLRDVTIIETGMGDGDCGYPFMIGERYLIFAYGTKTPYVTSICARISGVFLPEGRLSDDLKLLKQLNLEGKK